MSYRITEESIACGVCQSECPEKAISEGTEHSVIDPEKCSD